MTQQDFSLAQVFSDLANDPPWGSIGVILLAEARIRQARLALMVVDRDYVRLLERAHFTAALMHLHGDELPKKALQMILEEESINPDHYAKVKERVKKADTKET